MSAPDRWADDSYRVETPERLELEYDVAGLGSRSLATLIDLPIQGILAALIATLGTLGMALAGTAILSLVGIELDRQAATNSALAIGIFLSFAISWGYYIFFEAIWDGQTPGKRLTGLRVIKEGGYPLSFVDSVVRNVVRLVDFLPAYYIVGAGVMLFDRRSRRLGDLAAGTLVVKERRDINIASLVPAPGPASDAALPDALPPLDEPALPNLSLLSPADQSLVRQYLERRATLDPPAAADLAARLAAALAGKIGYELNGEAPEVFLRRLDRQAGRRT